MSDVLEQLRAIADGRGSAPDKELHPDTELLRAAATYLDLCAEIETIWREAVKKPGARVGDAEFDAALRRRKEKKVEARKVLARLGKTRAATAAGVYAKATIVTTQRGGMSAPRFMLSLATDLVNNPTLRASLWPTEAV